MDKVITSHREALALCPVGHMDRLSALDNLATALRSRYQQSGSKEDLDEVIAYNCEALTLCPLGHLSRLKSLITLMYAFPSRYQKSNSMEDLEEAIKCSRETLTLCPYGHPNHSTVISTLAGFLYVRYQRSDEMADLEESIIYNREALALHPPGHPDRPTSLFRLGNAVCLRYEKSGRIQDLEEATTYSHEALTLRVGHPSYPSCLDNFTKVLYYQYERSGRLEDLDKVITFRREALALHTLGHSDRVDSLINLATSLGRRFQQSGRIEDLEDAITYSREALTLRPLGHPYRHVALNNLGRVVHCRYQHWGKIEDLEEAIILIREAFTLGDSERSDFFSSLGDAVFSRYEQGNRMQDLEETITLRRKALTLCPLHHPDRPTYLHSLATAAVAHFVQSGRVDHVEEAIRCNREALTIRSLGHPNYSGSLLYLARAVHFRYLELGRIEDLEEAIKFNREALNLCPIGHMHRFTCLFNLGNAVYFRYEQSGKMQDLEDTITYKREALTLCVGQRKHSLSLISLADTIRRRYQQSGSMEDLEEAITYNREALALCSLGHPDRSMTLEELAKSVLIRYQKLGGIKDLEESFMLCEQAAGDMTASFRYRLNVAIRWADAAQLHRHSSVINAYSILFYLLDRSLISHPNIESQHKFLSISQASKSLASDAASAAIGAQNVQTAVELLERGRFILWSKMGGYRHPLDHLRHVDIQLADRLQTIGVELERLAISSESGPIDNGSPKSLAHLEAQMQRYRILSEEWEEVVGQIRKIEGFSNFLQAVPFATLQTAAAEGPVILINISKYRSDAIILHIDNLPILVNLPNVQPEHLAYLSEQLRLAQDPDVTDPGKLFIPILRDLWDDIVSPVCDRLAQLGVPQKSRVWWCPTSELCALPLHAAGPYQSGKRNLPDIYTSSYIPTLSSLIRARSNMIEQPITPKLLFIGQPNELPKVQEEIDHVRQLGEFVDVVVGTDASRDTVLHGLQHHSWAHFACHGHLGDKSQPFQASFELDGGSRLTLLDLIQARLPNAELAFLSACHSAAGDVSTPDERIHLASALQFCGFRSVVGTLWEMEDEDGPIISRDFYKYMFRELGNRADFRDSAEALNLAIRAMRRNRVPLERWIMFVHIGA